MATGDTKSDLSGRLAGLREAVFGPRGRAAFARALGVSPSTYSYYEKGRQPPADLIARAAKVTGADLAWLMTGEGEPFPQPTAGTADNTVSHPGEEVLDRLASALAAGDKEGPQVEGRGPMEKAGGIAPRGPSHLDPRAPALRGAAAAAALRAILARMEQAFPPAKETWRPSDAPVSPTAVPIVGRTAAGILAQWEKCFAGRQDPEVLERLIRQVEAKAARQRGGDLQAADPGSEPERRPDAAALLIQLSEPTPEGIVEYLDLPGVALGPGAFALRVDGDSMAPRIRDGDIVVCRCGVGPQPGQTAVVKVRGRIGVTVKLWRPEGEHVHLIPINEAYDPSRPLRTDVLWACRVLWVVRL
ncbi:MAG: helix-turn-helix domain-containing protein [Planctomycetes bacterium]|nr:helix-turn-helix domain-containing protein [Planctomycetota bacterium]